MTAQGTELTEVTLHSNIIATDSFHITECNNGEFMLLNTIRWMNDSITNYSALNEIPPQRKNDYASYSDKDWGAYLRALKQGAINTPWIILKDFSKVIHISIESHSGKMSLEILLGLISAAAEVTPNAVYIARVLQSIRDKQSPQSVDAIKKFIESSCQQGSNMNNDSGNHMNMILTSSVSKGGDPKVTFITLGKKGKILHIHEMTYLIISEKWREWYPRVNKLYQKDVNEIIELYD